MMEPKYECLKCGFVCDEYSRPHFPPETEGDARRTMLKVLHKWSSFEMMPRSLRKIQDVCWGTVVSTYKYNRPL